MAPAKPPNVVVVVLDCARADDFARGFAGASEMPNLSALRRECEVYPMTATTAPWTVPAHASLFTGLFPWEHGCHAKSALKLSADRPTLATVLGESGYRSFSLSANHLISADLGLVAGFDRSAWAGWWEPYLRVGGIERPPHVLPPNGYAEDHPPLVGRSGPLWSMIKRASHLAYRFPFILDGAGRLTTAVRGAREYDPLAVSSWIEPTLGRWISETPRDTPVFAFVNLLETHEPYYPDGALAPGVASWWRYSRYRQDHVGWLSGRWTPSAEEYAHLHALYRRTFRSADRRVGRIIDVLKDSDRWDNTLLLLTSDHGQAFGEQGMFFHMLRLPEALIRVPLVVRRPGGASAGSSATGWASLVDIAPTVLEAAGRTGAVHTSGVALETLLDRPRPGAICSASDGLVWRTIVPEHEKARFSERRRAEFDRILACAYQEQYKVVYDSETRQFRAFDIERDPGESTDLWPTEGERLAGLAEEARYAAVRMAATVHEETPSDVEERLRSWGYI
jgi:arylsulfatase A-like enzyme